MDPAIRIQELESLLANAKGQALAATRAQQEAERALEKERIQINVQREELESAITNSVQQVQCAVAISYWIWGLAHWANRLIVQSHMSKHILLRENYLLELCNKVVKAYESQEPERLRDDGIKHITQKLQEQVAIRTKSEENVREQITNGFIMACDTQGQKRADAFMANDKLIYDDYPGAEITP